MIKQLYNVTIDPWNRMTAELALDSNVMHTLRSRWQAYLLTRAESARTTQDSNIPHCWKQYGIVSKDTPIIELDKFTRLLNDDGIVPGVRTHANNESGSTKNNNYTNTILN